MNIDPKFTFIITLSWREIKLLRRALELEGGNGRALATEITKQVSAIKTKMIDEMSNEAIENGEK